MADAGPSARTIFWTFIYTSLQALQLTTSDVCQTLCVCHQAGTGISVVCSGQDLLDIPSDFPQNVSHFDLTMNNLTALRSNNFDGLSSLLELHLDHNHIRDIAAGTFVGLPNLTTLSLGNNDLQTLESHVFTGLSLQHLNLNDNPQLRGIAREAFVNAKVETLSLDRCAIRDVPPSLFAPLRNSLKYIHWSQSVYPLHIPEGLLEGLEIDSLRLTANSITGPAFLDSTHALHIDLTGNLMRSFNLSAYTGLTQTDSLILASNLIQTILVGEEHTILHLKDLDVSHNKLIALDGSIFQFTPNMTRLDASANSITRLQPQLHAGFSQLVYLDLTENPLACNCALTWFLQWASLNSDTMVGENICPANLNLTEKGMCRPPRIVNTYDQEEHQGFVLSCEAEGSPAPNTTWFINITRHDNFTDFESTLHRSSNLSKITVYIDHIVQERTCISALCVADNIMGSAHDALTNCYDANNGENQGIRQVSYTYYLQPVLGTIVCLSLLVVGVVVIGKYIRSKGNPWKSLLYSADHALAGERTLISDVDADEEREQMSTESV